MDVLHVILFFTHNIKIKMLFLFRNFIKEKNILAEYVEELITSKLSN